MENKKFAELSATEMQEIDGGSVLGWLVYLLVRVATTPIVC